MGGQLYVKYRALTFLRSGFGLVRNRLFVGHFWYVVQVLTIMEVKFIKHRLPHLDQVLRDARG